MKSNGAQSTAKRSTIDGRKLKFVHMALVLRWVANQTFFKNGKLDKIDDEHKLNANQIKRKHLFPDYVQYKYFKKCFV